MPTRTARPARATTARGSRTPTSSRSHGEAFDRVLGDRPNQLDVERTDVEISAEDLLNIAATEGDITEAGLRNNVSVAIQYIAAWLRGSGAVAIFNLMEDAATSEISRSQIWQWIHHGKVTRERVQQITDEEVGNLGDGYDEARSLFETLIADDDFIEFLTLPAYETLIEADV